MANEQKYEEQINLAVRIVKVKVGISIDEKDDYLKLIIESIIDEVKTIHGITDFDLMQAGDFMLLVDYSEWRYSSRGEGGYYEFRAPNGEGANIMPQHLAWRLKNRYLMKNQLNRNVGEDNGE